MSLTADTMLKLMAYADGELEGEERLAVEKLLASNVEAVRFMTDVGHLGDYVVEGTHAKTASFDVVDDVMAKIEAQSASTASPEAKVTSVPRVAEVAAEIAAEAASPERATANKPVVASIDAARQRRALRLRLGAGIAAALALAASFVLFARPKEEPMAARINPSTSAEPGSSSGSGVEVMAVESPGHSVSVFYLPSANEVSTSVVVWVDETGER